MDAKVITAGIAAISAIVASIVTAIASGFSSRQKLRELSFQYETRLRDGYLEKARDYTTMVYVPICIALSKLDFAFQHFRSTPTTDEVVAEFKTRIGEFIETFHELSSRGANAFMTTDLDETIQRFLSFLASSVTAQNPILKVVMKFSANTLWTGTDTQFERVVSGTKLKYFKSRPVSLQLGPFGFAYEGEEIVSAPISSVEFAERFSKDTHLINVLIKEVTLGSVARKST